MSITTFYDPALLKSINKKITRFVDFVRICIKTRNLHVQRIARE
jgi:hypothetical protein